MGVITEHVMYHEGKWAGQKMIKHIDKTTYETIEGAILAKSELIKNFEEEFGFSRDMDNPDSNYAHNLGILDALIEHHEQS